MTQRNRQQWKTIDGFSRYQFGERGQIRSVPRTANGRTYPGKVLATRPNNRGYLMVDLTDDNGVKHTVTVHSMILEAFRGKPQPGQEACHGPGGQTDNSVTNLRWGWPPENVSDRYGPPESRKKAQPKMCVRCGERPAGRGGQRCHPCVAQLGERAAFLLWSGWKLDRAAEELGYPSLAGLHALAVKYGGYGRPPWVWTVRVTWGRYSLSLRRVAGCRWFRYALSLVTRRGRLGGDTP